MPAILDDLRVQIEATVGVIDSATELINGFTVRLQAAVAEAIANGATAEELAPIQGLINSLKRQTDILASAVAANNS